MSHMKARVAAALLLVAALAQTGRAEHDWSGPYIGVDGGFGWGQASTAFNGDGDADGIFGTGNGAIGEAPDGGFNQGFYRDVYGLYAGYNVHVWRGFITGFEAAYNISNMRAESDNPLPTLSGTPNAGAAATSADTRITSLFSLAPQVGYGWGRVLLRTKGGVAGGRVASHLFSSLTNNTVVLGPTEFGQDQVRIGWTWGGGIDFALTEHWIAGLAFDYYDLGTFHFGGQSVPDVSYPVSYDVHPILRVGTMRISYKFGGGAEASPRPLGKPAPEPAATSDPHAALIAALDSGDENTRAEAAVALGDLRVLDAVDPLIAALSGKSISVRGAAANALGMIGSKKAFAPLLALLQDKQPEIRALAARALGVLGDSEALPALRKTSARDADATVRRLAAAAVKLLSRP